MLTQITNLTTAELTVMVEGVAVQLAAGDSTYSSTLSVADRSAQLRGDLLAVAVPANMVRLEGKLMVAIPEQIIHPEVFPEPGKAPAKPASFRAKNVAPASDAEASI